MKESARKGVAQTFLSVLLFKTDFILKLPYK